MPNVRISKAAAAKAAKAPAAASVTAPAATAPKADAPAPFGTRVNLEAKAVARTVAARVYNGASLTIHTSDRARKFAEYCARIASPVQRAASESVRDQSALASIARHADASGTFDPVAIACDLGGVSRLASLGLLALNSDGKPTLSPTGKSRAAAIAKA